MQVAHATAKASHSGSGQTAWVSVDARCDPEPLAAFTAFALSEFDIGKVAWQRRAFIGGCDGSHLGRVFRPC
jgi:hypothetical protein